jgi:DNA-binding FadR family transcriptional regulator
VSVAGTIFSVNHGARGSRVSVLDGEVRVRQAPSSRCCVPASSSRAPAASSACRSRRTSPGAATRPAYRQRLQALRAIGRELDAILAPGEGRTSTRLLDLAPASTMVWAAAPNLSQSAADAWALLEQRAAENPALAQWWQERITPQTADEIRAALDDLRDLGSHLGNEIAVALPANGAGQPGGPLLLAEVTSPSGLAEAIDQEIARLATRLGEPERLVRIEDPTAVAADDHRLFLWLAPGNVLAASPSIERLRELEATLAQGTSPFTNTAFHGRVAAAYANGVEWLVAADLGTALQRHTAQEMPTGMLGALGLDDVQHVVVESRGSGETSAHRAELSFRGERHGVAGWLAEPAPSGALEFVLARRPVRGRRIDRGAARDVRRSPAPVGARQERGRRPRAKE